MTFDFKELCPQEEERGRNATAHEKYLARVRSLETGIPDEVLLDWFQEQPEAAPGWNFLDPDNIAWAREVFVLDNLPGAEVFRRGAEQFYGLIRDVPKLRQWVYRSIKTGGTWHSPPILLRTDGMTFRTEPPALLRRPLHLAEGYHRLAALHALKAEPGIKEEHQFWVGAPKPA